MNPIEGRQSCQFTGWATRHGPGDRRYGVGCSMVPSPTELLNSLRSSDEQVDESSDQVAQEDDQDPDDLVVSFGWFFGCAVNEHPDPEDCASGSQDQEKE